MSEALAPAWDVAAQRLDEYPLATERLRYAVGIRPLLELPRDARILEAGCGSGRLLRTLASLGFEHLVGLEISPQRLAHVRQRGPHSAELVCSEQIPFAPDSFDAVVSAGVIEHVADPRDWLAQLACVVRPGGMISLTSDTYMWRWLQRLGLYRSIQPLDRAIWPLTLAKWGRAAGLELKAWGGFYNTPDQRWFFVRQLARLGPGWKRLRWYLSRNDRTPDVPEGEIAAIRDAFHLLPQQACFGLWHNIWSYESFYWFRKRQGVR